MRKLLCIFSSVLFLQTLVAQTRNVQATDWQQQIDFEQNRLDMADGELDSRIHIGNIRLKINLW